jgi:hypothetical protein
LSRPIINNKKQEKVLAYIQRKQPVEQAKIIKHFFDEFGYQNLASSRVSVGRLLKNLETNNLIKKQSVMNESSGSINKNIWSAR